MSWGTVICSKCNREVGQKTNRLDENGGHIWFHRANDTPCCAGAEQIWPPDGWKEPEEMKEI